MPRSCWRTRDKRGEPDNNPAIVSRSGSNLGLQSVTVSGATFLNQFLVRDMSYSPASGQSQFALKLFGTYLAVVVVSSVLARGLVSVLGGPLEQSTQLVLPPVFLYSSVLLIVGSAMMHRAVSQVKIERQKPFRQSLVLALIAGTLFVGSQSYGLWYLLKGATPAAHTETGAQGFAFVFAVLHVLHFTVAMMFLVYVMLRSFQDRYDHEYYFGVTVCTWFWHVLGIVWVAILLVFYFVVTKT
jgi:heme/copper-type cytochrome/quinol oxidase subunit 3